MTSIAKPKSPSVHSVMSMMGVRYSTAYRIGKGGFKIPMYQNTYRFEPLNPFKVEVVDKILKEVMEESLRGVKYNQIISMDKCKTISAIIRDCIYKKSYDRYKYIVLVTIIQKLGQGVQIDLGYLWDANRDTYSFHVLESTDFIAVGVVAAVYYE